MEQYKEVYCWKCLKCGRVLTTPGGQNAISRSAGIRRP